MLKFTDFLLNESGLGGKSSTGELNWIKYIEGKPKWLSEPLVADKAGIAYNLDEAGRLIELFKFPTRIKIQLLSLVPIAIGRSQFVKCAIKEKNSIEPTECYVNINYIQKPTKFATKEVGVRVQERQENGVIDSINKYHAMVAKPINVTGKSGTIIKNVIGASKNAGMNSFGKEPYVDVWIFLANGKRIGVSNKGTEAPSLFGGGLGGMLNIDPNYVKRVFNKALNAASKSDKFELNNPAKTKEIFIKITNKAFLKKSLIGTTQMGGPVDMMYIGKMDVKNKFDDKTNTLKFENGTFYTIEEYLKAHPELYLRIRRRDSTQFFTLEKDSNGIPYIFKNNANSRARLVTSSHTSSLGLVLDDK